VPAPPLDPTVYASLRGVGVDYDGRPALNSIDLDIRAGTLTVVAGPNGAGKSTLLEVIAGTRSLSRGSRSSIPLVAFVPQRAAVSDRLPVTVRDVVSIGTWGRTKAGRQRSSEARDAMTTAMNRLEIARLAATPFSSLSGGQRQRALLAQGLARGADMLLLDEPTTGLDSGSAEQIREIMRSEAGRGVAVVCVSHDPAVLSIAGRIVRLEDGIISLDRAS